MQEYLVFKKKMLSDVYHVQKCLMGLEGVGAMGVGINQSDQDQHSMLKEMVKCGCVGGKESCCLIEGRDIITSTN